METLIDLIEQLKNDMYEIENTYIDDDNNQAIDAMCNLQSKAFYAIEIAKGLREYVSSCEGLIKRMGWQ